MLSRELLEPPSLAWWAALCKAASTARAACEIRSARNVDAEGVAYMAHIMMR